MYHTYDLTSVFYTNWCCLLLISPLSLCCAGEPMPARPSTSMMWGRQRACRLKAAMNSWIAWKCLEILWISLQFLESRKIPVTKNCRSAVLQVTDASDQRSSRLERCSDKGKPTHCFEAQRIPKRKWVNYCESTRMNTRICLQLFQICGRRPPVVWSRGRKKRYRPLLPTASSG